MQPQDSSDALYRESGQVSRTQDSSDALRRERMVR